MQQWQQYRISERHKRATNHAVRFPNRKDKYKNANKMYNSDEEKEDEKKKLNTVENSIIT